LSLLFCILVTKVTFHCVDKTHVKYTQFTVSVRMSQFVCTLNNKQQNVLHGQEPTSQNSPQLTCYALGISVNITNVKVNQSHMICVFWGIKLLRGVCSWLFKVSRCFHFQGQGWLHPSSTSLLDLKYKRHYNLSKCQ
jgi:hypothetical protein